MTPPSSEPTLAHVVGELAGTVTHPDFPAEKRAALRRMTIGREPPLAFYWLAVRHLPAHWAQDQDAWALLTAGLARMPAPAIQWDRPFGAALALADFPASRLERLLSASTPATRYALLERALRWLAVKGIPFDWTDVARLLLTRDPHRREDARWRVAKQFYRAADAAFKEA